MLHENGPDLVVLIVSHDQSFSSLLPVIRRGRRRLAIVNIGHVFFLIPIRGSGCLRHVFADNDLGFPAAVFSCEVANWLKLLLSASCDLIGRRFLGGHFVILWLLMVSCLSD